MRIRGIALKSVLCEIMMALGPHVNGSTALSSASSGQDYNTTRLAKRSEKARSGQLTMAKSNRPQH